MDTIGPWELLIIVVVLVALFGANRLPKMARGLGEGIREFKKGISEASSHTAESEPSGPAERETSGPAEQPAQPAEQPHAPSR
jgi:sec-independent protein translocase protein TatA